MSANDRKTGLIRSAEELNGVSDAVLRAYAQAGPAAAQAVTEALEARADVDALVGGKRAMMADNHANHVRYVQSVLAQPNPRLLVETVVWVYRTYLGHGFSPDYWPVFLPLLVEGLRSRMPGDAFAEVEPLYRWFMDHHRDFLALAAEDAGPSPWEAPPHG